MEDGDVIWPWQVAKRAIGLTYDFSVAYLSHKILDEERMHVSCLNKAWNRLLLFCLH